MSDRLDNRRFTDIGIRNVHTFPLSHNPTLSLSSSMPRYDIPNFLSSLQMLLNFFRTPQVSPPSLRLHLSPPPTSQPRPTLLLLCRHQIRPHLPRKHRFYEKWERALNHG